MPFLAPWLQGTDVLGAIRAGSGVGLQIRQQDAAEQAAAARLMQAQIEQQQQQQAQAIQQQQAAERLRQSQQEMFNQARQQEIANQIRGDAADLDRQKFDEAQATQSRLEEANKLFGSTLATGLSGEKPDILGAFSKAASVAPGASAVQKLDADALIRAQQNDQNSGMSRGLMTYYAQLGANTGENILNPTLPGGIDPNALTRATQKMGGEGGIVQQRLTPMIKRTSDAMIADQETEAGTTLSPQDKAKTERLLMSYGGKNPTLDPDTRSKINVAEYASDATQKLADEIAKHPEVKFGPGVFTFDVKKGEWVGGDPEASKILQLYNTLYAGQAFAQGGKTLTPTEVENVKNQIGNPNQSNFVAKLKTAQLGYLENLGLSVRTMQDKGFTAFPAYQDWSKRLQTQYEEGLKKNKLTPSGAFAAPLNQGQNIPAPAQRESGKVYQTPRGPMKWTGTGWVPQ